MDELENLLKKVSLNEKTNMENKEKREFVLQNLNLVEPFNGQQNKLALFVTYIDSLVAIIVTMSAEDKVTFFNAVQRKLTGAAADILRRESPEDWKTLKTLLIEEFGESKHISTLILEISKIKFKNSVKVYCDLLNEEICRIKDCVKLSEESELKKRFYYSEIDRSSVQVLKEGLPTHITALLNANLVSDFKSAIKVLRTSGTYSFEYKDRNYRRTAPSSSNNLQNTSSQHYQNNWSMSPPFFPQYTYNPNQPIAFNQPSPVPQNSYQATTANTQQIPAPRGNDSNQSRIRRFGAPIPMEQDSQNFHFIAPGNYQP